MCRPFTKQLLTLRVGRDVPKKTAAKAIMDEYITKTLQLNGVSMTAKFADQGASHSTYTNIMKFFGAKFSAAGTENAAHSGGKRPPQPHKPLCFSSRSLPANISNLSITGP